MNTHWIAIVSAIIASIALLLNVLAYNKHKKNTQLNLLADFSSRYFDLVAKQEDYREKNKKGEFALLFLNHLEWFAYLVNNKFIPLGMAEIYQGIIINWYEKAWKKQQGVLSDYLEDQPKKFTELEKLYKKLKKK